MACSCRAPLHEQEGGNDEEGSQARAFKLREGLVELPEGLVDLFARMYVEERYGVDLGVGAAGDDQPDRR